MQPVIYPVSKEKLLAELTKDKLVRKTNKAENEIYSFNAFNAPNLMRTAASPQVWVLCVALDAVRIKFG